MSGPLIEAAALALAETRPKERHGQLCPVWTQRLRKVRHAATISDCDCWILSDARRDASVVAAALSPAREPTGLDVERLARAMFCATHATALAAYDKFVPPNSAHRAEHEERAFEVAALYASLAAPDDREAGQ